MSSFKIPKFYPKRKSPVNRADYLISESAGKSILHLGCADSPYTKRKFENGELLHQKLANVASRCVGIDIDKEAISWLKENNINDVYTCQVEDLAELLKAINFEPDIVIAGEIVEHLPNPSHFLRELLNCFTDDTVLLITVPNSFYFRSFVHILFGGEKVHPDHVAYYSPSTINTLLQLSGFQVNEITPYTLPSGKGFWSKLKKLIESFILWIQPYFCPGLVVSSRPNPEEKQPDGQAYE